MAVKRSKSSRAKNTRSIKMNTPVGQPLTSGVQVYTGQYSDTGQAMAQADGQSSASILSIVCFALRPRRT
jgi:hypothetical protein